jgi:hypothetical protein
MEHRADGPDARVDRDRRRFLGTAASVIVALGAGSISARKPREFDAIGRATSWLNSPRLTASSLNGKVVLVNFCTYTCINWLRTLPYIRRWADHYRKELLVVGVHTPEFGFEHNVDNVRRAMEQLQITYPVVMDNDYAIWRAFQNHYWPALYFIDSRSRVRDRQFGEGAYDKAESIIRRLLADAGTGAPSIVPAPVGGSGVEAAADWRNLRSPENYLGYQRTAGFASPGSIRRGRPHMYSAPTRLGLNQWALSGEWLVGQNAASPVGVGAGIAYRFHSRDLHLVMGPARHGSQVRFKVSVDGHPPGGAHGADVDANGNGIASEQRLYQLIRQTGAIVDRRFEIEFLDAGMEAFAFTFG